MEKFMEQVLECNQVLSMKEGLVKCFWKVGWVIVSWFDQLMKKILIVIFILFEVD